MGLSRVEKYREYRKSILSSEDSVLKTPIDTNLDTNIKEPLSSTDSEEAVFIKKIIRNRRIDFILFFGIVCVLVIMLIVYGTIVF